MSEILIESLGTSRYAPVNINAYQYNGLAGLSFGQLIMAVCCRRAAAIESQSVIKMNQLTQSDEEEGGQRDQTPGTQGATIPRSSPHISMSLPGSPNT